MVPQQTQPIVPQYFCPASRCHATEVAFAKVTQDLLNNPVNTLVLSSLNLEGIFNIVGTPLLGTLTSIYMTLYSQFPP